MKQRDIKFRAWIPTEETMFYQNDQYLQSFLRRANFASTGYEHDSYGTPHLMQWTGLQDSRGKPIYEGDIVKWMEPGYDSLQPDKVRTSEVKWVQCGFAPFLWIEKNERFHDDHEAGDHLVDLTSDYHYYYAFEVIGNIYQNPDLLNETTN